ncbi:hypothetical protein GYMLUDRAFT_68896 [Collybiopsis luxurians FD-317 M1]|nr:hypothetical protein GYMLUDRAFT_68896 [Collybiopsis luxurians FD-317 M1]
MPVLRTRNTQNQGWELSVDTPSLPTLVAPTPRAFTFPLFHGLEEISCTSSTSSPFEHQPGSFHLPSLPSSNFSTPPPSPKTLSPDPVSVDAGRRPVKGDVNYIKRPENSFILFRRKWCKDHLQQTREKATHNHPAKKQRQADLSKIISFEWKSLSDEERKYWDDLADAKKREHQQMYPNYVYRPQRTARDQDGKARNKPYSRRKTRTARQEGTSGEDEPFLVPSPGPIGQHTSIHRSPTLTYQTIGIPDMFNNLSSPSSMSMFDTTYTNTENMMSNFNSYFSNSADLSNHEHGLQLLPFPGDALSMIRGSLSTSGPYSSSSAPPSFAHAATFPADNLLPVHMGAPAMPDVCYSSWSIWQNEPSLLLQTDPVINAIPPTEPSIPNYPDGSIFGGMEGRSQENLPN